MLAVTWWFVSTGWGVRDGKRGQGVRVEAWNEDVNVRPRERRPGPVDRVHMEPPVAAHLGATRDHADPPRTVRIERLDRGQLHTLRPAEDELGRLDLVERRVPDVQVNRVRVAVIREEREGRDAGEGRVPQVRRLNRVDPEAGTEE